MIDKHSEKKAQILHAGLEVMTKHGYNGTGIKDIVDAAGIPKGSFYNYFESKEAFALEALDCVFRSYIDQVHGILENDRQPALARVEIFFGSAMKSCQAANYSLGCFIGNLCQEMSDVSEPIRVKVDTLLGRITEKLEQCLRELQKEGQLAPDRDVGQLAEFLFNAWEGTVTRTKSARNDKAMAAFMTMLRVLCER